MCHRRVEPVPNASGNEAALLYNDVSVNKEGHVAPAFRILGRPQCELLGDPDRGGAPLCASSPS